MLKALIKKQFMESFRSYFVNRKTGKARSKGQITGMFIGFAFLMIFASMMFFGISLILGMSLLGTPISWLYYTLMGMIAIMMGTFGSVFNTFSSLYLAKDNELLLSMPIPAGKILLSRMIMVMALSMLYTGMAWIPTIIMGQIFGGGSVLDVILRILMFFVLSTFVSVLTCVLGFLVALISSRLKSKNIMVVILSLAFFVVYYYVCFNLDSILEGLLEQMTAVGNTMKTYLNFFYQMGMGADGDMVSFLIFTVIVAVLAAICFTVMAKTFRKIIARNNSGNAVVKKKELDQVMNKTVKVNGLTKTLLMKEFKRFTASSTYMMNCGLGLFFLPIIAIIAVVKRADIAAMLTELSQVMPVISQIMPLLVIFALCLICSMNMISTPSVSLEGKNLWILRSLPVSGKDILNAKLLLHVIINLVSAVPSTIVIGWAMGFDMMTVVMILLFVVCYIYLDGGLGLMLGVTHPNLNWISEVQPIKQSVNVMIAMFGGWILTAILAGLYFAFQSFLGVTEYLTGAVVVIFVLASLVRRWLLSKGAEAWDKL